MATRLHFARINKELAFSRVFTQAKNQSLVAVATIGNTSSADKYKVRYDLEGVGATVNLTGVVLGTYFSPSRHTYYL